MESSPTWDFGQETLARMRRNYPTERLLESAVPTEPFAQFRSWLSAAVAVGLPEPNAMVLATATADGRPSVRHVLLKELDDSGFVFFTNLRSRKAVEIAANPAVSLCFPWFAMARQVVASGTAAQVSSSRDGGVLGHPPARVPTRRMGQRPVIGDRLASGARSGCRGCRREISRDGAGAAVLGRIPGDAARRGVLAGRAGASARPASIHADRRRLAAGPARSLTERHIQRERPAGRSRVCCPDNQQ